MTLKSILSLAMIFSSSLSFAVDTSQCPSSLTLEAVVTRVYSTSIYSKVPGWRDAQSTLSKNPVFASAFRLIRKTQKSCLYGDRRNNTATLTTATLVDPEMSGGTISNEIVILNYNIEASKFVSYVSVKSYSLSGVTLWESPSIQKIKTKLTSPERNRVTDYDLGMVSVKIK